MHRLMTRTARGPLRPLWSLGYRVLTRAVVAWIARGEDVTTYLRAGFASGDVFYGLSDVDVALVARDRAARDRVLSRWLALRERVRPLADLYDIAVYDPALLAAAASATTLTCDTAVYFGAHERFDECSLRERPTLYGPLSGWRHLRGTDRRPPLGLQTAQERRVTAWLELQAWWAYAFGACAEPDAPRKAHLCVKLVAEPARIWLWLAHGERFTRRTDVLKRAVTALPEEAEAFHRALALDASLAQRPAAPVGEFMPYLVSLSRRIAQQLASDVVAAGATHVELVGATAPQLPLADWRAVVWPSLPDETFVAVDGTPAHAESVRRALAPEVGPYNALSTGELLVLPATNRDNRLRAVQCAVTDPVSFALLAGSDRAVFPNVEGWSAEDWARRAVAEHRAWLGANRQDAELTVREWAYREGRRAPVRLRELGRLFTAARAAVFADGLARLPLTAHATAACLGIEDVHAEYAAARSEPRDPAGDALELMRDTVRRLPAFADSRALSAAAA